MLIRAAILAVFATQAGAEGITAARYAAPTSRYDHGILGDAIEWGVLEMTTDQGRRLRVTLPATRVFEDTEPRLADVDLDGQAEVIVVETDIASGARLAIYGAGGLIAATPHIGRTHRWLAPVGAADLDGDGLVEIAFIDRPHLARTLGIWRFRDGGLVPVAERKGLTNHRIGETAISGGIRTCGGRPEMILADADWQELQAATFAQGRITVRGLGPIRGRKSFTEALACRG